MLARRPAVGRGRRALIAIALAGTLVAVACADSDAGGEPADAPASAESPSTSVEQRPELVAVVPTGAAVDRHISSPPADFDPVAWTDLPPRPELVGPLAPNGVLAGADILAENELDRPEDIAPGLDGHLYTGTTDGGLWRIELDGDEEFVGTERVADLGGVVLGLDAYSDDTIVAAVVGRGLVAANTSTGDVIVLSDRFDGDLIYFPDGVDVATDGTIYFTEASTLYYPGFPYDLLDGRPRGRLFRFEPEDGRTTLVADGLHFANGVAVDTAETYALVAETWRTRLTRISLGSDDEGRAEPFGPPLISLPDNVRIDDRGRVWVGGSDLRNDAIDALFTSVDLRRVLSRQTPEQISSGRVPYFFAQVLDPDGRPIFSFHDGSGRYSSSAVLPGDRYVTFGSIRDRGIARVPMPAELAE